MSAIALECDNISKKFKKGESYDSLRDLIPALIGRSLKKTDENELKEKEFWALKDLCFQVKRGEALGIIGHNGAGKSTLLKLLCGIMKPTAGILSVNGKLSALIEVGAGFHQDLTGRENVYLNGVIMGMSRSEIRKKFDEIVNFSGIEEFIDTPVKRYSSGMYARLGFSVAAHVDPEILLVDEVLSVGDWTFQSKCAKKMEELIRDGATVVFVSHNLRAVAGLCKQCILLEHGSVVKTGLSEEVIRYYLESASKTSNETTTKNIVISQMAVLKDGHEEVRYNTGDKALVKVTVRSEIDANNLALHVYVVDGNYYEIFETSTELLGCGSFSVKEGEIKEFCVELRMHLGKGMYYLGAVVRTQFDISEQFDRKFPGATIYIDGTGSVRGSVNLYPHLV